MVKHRLNRLLRKHRFRVVIDNAPVAVPADTDVPAAAENNGDEAHSDNILPRRSRRSPRHLRVSGQRRRRYREDRQLTQSPVPLEMAVFSPNWLPGGSSIRSGTCCTGRTGNRS